MKHPELACTIWGRFAIGIRRRVEALESRPRPRTYKVIPCDGQFVVAEVLFTFVNGSANTLEGLRIVHVRPTEQAADRLVASLAALTTPEHGGSHALCDTED